MGQDMNIASILSEIMNQMIAKCIDSAIGTYEADEISSIQVIPALFYLKSDLVETDVFVEIG